MKKSIAILLALITLLSFAACGKTEAPSGPVDAPPPQQGGTSAPAPGGSSGGESATPAAPDYIGKTLTVAINQLPESLVEQIIKPTTGTLTVMPALYSRLYDFNEAGELVPNIATGYEWEGDRSLRVFLREDACTATGEKITAEDVAYSYTLGIDGVNASSYADIEEVIVEDEYTALIVLKQPSPTFVNQLDEEAFPIISKAGVEKDGGVEAASKAPYSCTTGPYKFHEWVEGQYITLQYNDNYYDDSYVPSYEFIKYVVIPDNASRCLAIQSGDADVAASITLADTMGYVGSDTIKVATVPNNVACVFFMNNTEGPFTNPKLREALGYLIDWQELADLITGGGKPLNAGSFPRSSPYFYDVPIPVEKDVEKGLALMAEAGYPDGFDFNILTAVPQVHHTNVALLIQSQLAEYGINVTVDTLELGVYFGFVDSGDYDAQMCNATDSFAVHLAFYDHRYTRAQNFGGPQLADDYVADLVAKARAEFDDAKRKEYTDAIQEFMIENHVGYGICDEVNYVLYNAEVVQDMSSNSMGLKPQYVRPAN